MTDTGTGKRAESARADAGTETLFGYGREQHADRDELTVCVGQWCCGCDEHPIGKPWGWNFEAWERHYAEAHRA